MLFKILKSLMFIRLIMWIDGEGGTDLGTGVANDTVAQGDITPEVQGDTTQTDNPVTEPTISVAEAMKLKEENQRLRDYNDFIKQAGSAPVKTAPEFKMDPGEIPYVEDVDKIVDFKMQKFQRDLEAKQVETDLRTMADGLRASDPGFDKRMELALEYLERDEIAQANFERARTAKDKLAVLEKLAKWHPLYESVSKPAPVTDAVQRLQQNAQLPATIATMQTAGKTRKSVEDMTPEEYNAFFKEVTKGY